LEAFAPARDIFRDFRQRQRLYRAVGESVRFLAAYERLLADVVLPHLRARLDAALPPAAGSRPREAGRFRFWAQWPPSLRVQPGCMGLNAGNEAHGRVHRDAEYGHQPGEINFWMPLTSFARTGTTLMVEDDDEVGDEARISTFPKFGGRAGGANSGMSAPDRQGGGSTASPTTETGPERPGFHPLCAPEGLRGYGDIGAFHGTLRRHFAPPNRSAATRVSIDFRVGIGRVDGPDFFDPDWRLPGVKARHGRRLFR
jgi:hypothetical protein